MNCIHCGHPETRVLDVKRVAEGLRRHRVCKACGGTTPTLERVESYDANTGSYTLLGAMQGPTLRVVPDQPPGPGPAAEARRIAKVARRYQTAPDDPTMTGLPADVRALLVEWWNESRYSKHRSKATWTHRAFEASVRRVAALPQDDRLALCQKAVEMGWQAIDGSYLRPPVPTAIVNTGGDALMPRDQSMRAALESWPDS